MTVLAVSVALVILVLSFFSSMLGLGVAFIAIPVLGLFGLDLKHEIMPLALLLNGLTATSGALAYLRKKMVDLRTAIPLLVISMAAAPLGVYLLQFVSTDTVWWVFVAVLVFLASRMVWGQKPDDGEGTISDRQRAIAGGLTVAISILAGFLGVGPGFLLMPTLVLLGYPARTAAATNAVIVTLPSFTAFAGHLTTAQLDWSMLILASMAGVIGAQAGALVMARRIRSATLTRLFAVLLVVLAVQRIYLLIA